MKLLAGKPFYFLTDRDTNYTFLVHNNKKELYYPDKFEQFSPEAITKYKQSFVRQFLFWGITNKKKMASQDFSIVFSRWFDGLGLFMFGIMSCLITKRLLGKINTPFIESMLQQKIITLPRIKSFLSIGIPLPLVYGRFNNTLNQNYLFDLALQYQYNFNKQLKDSHIQKVFDSLNFNRFQTERK